MTNSFVLTRWLLAGMRWLYESIVSFTGMQASYAIVLTILLFTVAIRCLTVFGDIKSRKSSMQMQEIQPDLDRLMKKYQNDPKRMNQERNKLMKEKGVSTMSGCLPLLIMMPLLFMFINAFRAWSNEQMLSLMLTMDKDPQAGINLFSQYKFFWILNIWRPDNLTSSAVLTGEQFWRTFAATKATYIDKFIFYTEHQQALDELLLRMGFFVKDAAGALTLAEDNSVFLAAYETMMGPCIDAYKLCERVRRPADPGGCHLVPAVMGVHAAAEQEQEGRGDQFVQCAGKEHGQEHDVHHACHVRVLLLAV